MSNARWRGVVALVRDSVEHGSRAVERIQLDVARRPFALLEHIPPLAAPVKVVHVVHDASVRSVHLAIRGVNAVVATSVDVVLQHLDQR